MKESEMTDFQKWMLRTCKWGAGISRKLGDMTLKEIKEADAMVAAGILKRSKNFKNDKHGMYIISDKSTAQEKHYDAYGENKE